MLLKGQPGTGLEKMNNWLTPERASAFQALGLGLSQLSAGQPVDMSGPYAALAQRQQRAKQQEMLQTSGALERFTPEEQAILAAMPAQAAQQVIMERVFAPKTVAKRDTIKGADGFNYYIDTGERVLPGVSEPAQSPTDDVREYQFAVTQGYGGTFEDWMLENRKAGASSVNVGAAETKYDQERGKGFATQIQTYEDEGAAAQRALSSLDVMEQSMQDPNFYSGIGSDTVKAAKKLAVAFGFDPGGIDSMEAFNSQAKAAALDVMGGSLGAGFSDADRSFVEDQVANLDVTPGGNRKIIEIQRALQGRKIEIMQMALEYEREHGRLDAGFNRFLVDWANKNPVFGTPKANLPPGTDDDPLGIYR